MDPCTCEESTQCNPYLIINGGEYIQWPDFIDVRWLDDFIFDYATLCGLAMNQKY